MTSSRQSKRLKLGIQLNRTKPNPNLKKKKTQKKSPKNLQISFKTWLQIFWEIFFFFKFGFGLVWFSGIPATLVFIFGPNLKTKTLLWPRLKLNNRLSIINRVQQHIFIFFWRLQYQFNIYFKLLSYTGLFRGQGKRGP